MNIEAAKEYINTYREILNFPKLSPKALNSESQRKPIVSIMRGYYGRVSTITLEFEGSPTKYSVNIFRVKRGRYCSTVSTPYKRFVPYKEPAARLYSATLKFLITTGHITEEEIRGYYE